MHRFGLDSSCFQTTQINHITYKLSNFIQYKNRSNKRSILDYDNARTELLSIEGQEYSMLAKKAAKIYVKRHWEENSIVM